VTERKIALQTRILAIGAVGGAGLSFVIFAAIGRVLGEVGLGAYAVALAYAYPASIVVEFGLGTLLIRDSAGSVTAANALLRPVMVQRTVMGSAVMLALVACAPILSSDPVTQRAIAVAAPLVLLTPLFSVFAAVLRVGDRVTAIAALNIGMLLVQAALTVGVLISGGGVLGALAVNTLTSAGQVLAVWWLWRKYSPLPDLPAQQTHSLPDLPPLAQGREIAALVRRALPFAVGGVLAAISMRAAIVLLEFLTDARGAGIFSAANRFIDAAKLIPIALYGAMLPALSALAGDPKSMRRAFAASQRRLVVYGMAAGLALALAAPLAIRVIFGAGFGESVVPLMILSIGLVAATGRGGALVWCYASGRERRANVAIAVGLVVTIGVGLALIPAWGAVGAAVAVVAGDGVVWRMSILENRATLI